MFKSESSQTLLTRNSLLQNEVECLFFFFLNKYCWYRKNKNQKGKEVIVLIILAAASIPSFYVVVFDNSMANHCELVIEPMLLQ